MTRASEFDWHQLQQTLEGRYLLERRVGRGGMGVVYRARELRLDRPVAIKVLPPDKAAHPAARERFVIEARTAAQLSHPNIIPIFAVDEIGEVVFYAMAFVDGETLGQHVTHHGPLEPAAAVRVLRDVARALAYAHARHVVHRDIKPDNILLDAATGRALVSDFGIARVGDGGGGGGTIGPTEVVGTAEFMSPEQAAGGPVDARSDLYSTGVLGYYALSGRLPFVATDPVGLLLQHLAEAPRPLSAVAPTVPRRLVQVIHRCLAKDPSARFPDATALAEALTLVDPNHAAPPVALRAFMTDKPLSALAALRAVRRLLAAGRDRDDLTDVLAADLERRREELAFIYGTGPSRLEWALRALAYAGLASVVAVAGLGVAAPAWAADIPLLPAFGLAAAGALLGALGARLRAEQRRDRKAERRLRFWNGVRGRWIFALAGLGLPRPGAERAVQGGPGDSLRTSGTDVPLSAVGEPVLEALPGTTDP